MKNSEFIEIKNHLIKQLVKKIFLYMIGVLIGSIAMAAIVTLLKNEDIIHFINNVIMGLFTPIGILLLVTIIEYRKIKKSNEFYLI